MKLIQLGAAAAFAVSLAFAVPAQAQVKVAPTARPTFRARAAMSGRTPSSRT